jgi:transposase
VRATTLVGRLIGVEQAVVEDFDIVDDPAKGRLVLTAQVRPYRRAKPRCSQCGVRCPGYDQGGGPRRWRALDLGEIVVYLAATMFRVTCPEHGVVVAKVGWAHPGSRFTAAFEDSVAWMNANMPATAVATFLRVTFRAVDGIVTRVVDRAAGKVDLLDGLTSIAVDEVAYRKGQRYLTVIVDNDTGRLVWAAKGHGKAVLGAFFDALGPHRAAQLQLVSADGAGTADGWIATVVKQRAPQAVRCMDPFHTVAWATEALDQVRRATVRHLSAAGDKAGLELVKGSRWALLKNPVNLTAAQASTLAGVKEANADLFTAHVLKEQLRAVFHPPAGAGGRSVLAAWLSMVDEAGLPAFDVVADKVRRALPEIRATLDHHMNSARAEANNTTVRMLTRRGFGYHSADALIAITMLKRSGLCPDLPGRSPRHTSPQTAQAA